MTDTTAIEQRQDRTPAPLIQQIDQVMPQLERLGVDPDRFARVLLSECRKNEQLLACTPASFMGAAFASAQLRLEPGPLGEVWFIPRRNSRQRTTEVQWMLGYRGMVELARRAGVIVTVETVHANDHFEVTAGTDPSIVHRPTLDDRGQAIAWYAVARFPDGRTVHRVLNRDDVAERRAQSASKDRGPWVSHFDAMARKSAIRALWSQLPMVPELQDAARLDEQVLTMPTVDGPARPAIAGSTVTDAPAVTAGAGDPLDSASVHELRQACDDAGLDKQGDRAALVARIRAARDGTSGSSTLDEEGETGSDAPPAPPPPDEPDETPTAVTQDLDDPEDPMTEAQRKKLFALFGEHDISEEQRRAVVVGHYGVESMNDLTVGQAVKLIDLLESDGGPGRFIAAADEWLAAGEGSDEPPATDSVATVAADSGAGADGEAAPAPDQPADNTPDADRDNPANNSRADVTPADGADDLASRAYRHAAERSPVGKLQKRIRDAWGTLSVADHDTYAASWERVSGWLGASASTEDWSAASELDLRREAEDLTRAVSLLKADGKVR